LGRVAADAHRTEQRVDGRPGRRKDAMTERLAPAGDAGVGVDADEQHVDAGPRPAAEHGRGAVDHHRQVENDRGDACDLHGEPLCPRSEYSLRRRAGARPPPALASTAGDMPRPTRTKEARMARVTGLGHIGIYVRDLERMVAFYRDLMGMRVTKQNWRAGIVFLSADAESVDHELALLRGRARADD